MAKPRPSINASDRRPRTATERDDVVDARVSRTFLFLIIDARRLLAGGARFPLDGVDVVRFGRRQGDECAVSRTETAGAASLSIELPSALVSAEHASLRRTPTGWLLTDAGSKNGTYVDGAAITGETALRPGAVFKVGSAFFTVATSTLPAHVDLAEDLLGESVTGAPPFPGFPTLVPSLVARLADLRRAIVSPNPMTIVGETGTGKGLLGKGIHAASRAGRPFVVANCAALAPGLVDGQLFGYLKGGYSGAQRADPGYVKLAHGGTLLLDEIPDLPLDMQAKLLRVIEEREVVPLGTARGEAVDVRFLAATQTPLEELAARGRFRADLEARLAPHVIELPPLRRRREDMGLLTGLILRKHGVENRDGFFVRAEVVWAMLRDDWSRNVRGLDNKLLDALCREQGGALDLEIEHEPEPDAPAAAALSPADARERNEIVALLEKHQGNAAAVAREVGIARQQVYRWFKRLGLDPASFRGG